jgi:hypothetical protein
MDFLFVALRFCRYCRLRYTTAHFFVVVTLHELFGWKNRFGSDRESETNVSSHQISTPEPGIEI